MKRLGAATAVVLAAAMAVPASAQTGLQPAGGPILASVGGGLSAGTPEVGGQGSLTVSHRLGDVIVRFANNGDVELFGNREEVRDVSILYGRRTRMGRGWARAAAGVGHVRHELDEVVECVLLACSYEETVTEGVGLALQLDLVWAPVRAVGLGIGGMANLNGSKTFGAVTASLHLGLLR